MYVEWVDNVLHVSCSRGSEAFNSWCESKPCNQCVLFIGIPTCKSFGMKLTGALYLMEERDEGL